MNNDGDTNLFERVLEMIGLTFVTGILIMLCAWIISLLATSILSMWTAC